MAGDRRRAGARAATPGARRCRRRTGSRRRSRCARRSARAAAPSRAAPGRPVPYQSYGRSNETWFARGCSARQVVEALAAPACCRPATCSPAPGRACARPASAALTITYVVADVPGLRPVEQEHAHQVVAADPRRVDGERVGRRPARDDSPSASGAGTAARAALRAAAARQARDLARRRRRRTSRGGRRARGSCAAGVVRDVQRDGVARAARPSPTRRPRRRVRSPAGPSQPGVPGCAFSATTAGGGGGAGGARGRRRLVAACAASAGPRHGGPARRRSSEQSGASAASSEARVLITTHSAAYATQSCEVPGEGIEPPRPEGQPVLSRSRLPVPPPRQGWVRLSGAAAHWPGSQRALREDARLGAVVAEGGPGTSRTPSG